MKSHYCLGICFTILISSSCGPVQLNREYDTSFNFVTEPKDGVVTYRPKHAYAIE